MKQDIFNLIILDESGSMGCMRHNTITGCNETINTIRVAQEKFPDTQRHYVSIYAFQSGGAPSRYIIKNVPVADVRDITEKDYNPCGCTPLYDAVGSTLVDLKTTCKCHELAIGSVTIITDGMENASREYTLQKVSQMISALKEMGWSFNFIGANIDVAATAQSLNIDNHLEFTQDEAGVRNMFAKERACRMSYHTRLNDEMNDFILAEEGNCDEVSDEERVERRKSLIEKLKGAAKNYFDA